MKKPTDEDKRAPLYMVKPGPGTTLGTAGSYVGETSTHAVLKFSDGAVKGFRWEDLEPVTMREVGQ